MNIAIVQKISSRVTHFHIPATDLASIAFGASGAIDLTVLSECILIGETSRLQAVQQFMTKSLPNS
jgi:hypothetical protein